MDTNPQALVRYYRDFRVSDDYLADVESRGLVIPENLRADGVVKHRMINPLHMRSGFRGLSELFASREWFRVFKEFMEDRGAINAAANALAFQRKIAGGSTTVASLSGKIGGIQVTPGSDQPIVPSTFRRPMPGSVIDTSANVDWRSIRADTGAPNAMRDAELIRSTAGAGTATPDHYFGATNSALAGAQSVEVAVIKAFEDFQTFLQNDYRETVEYVISQALNRPAAEVDATEREIVWNFPPIMTQDIVKWVTGFAQWTQQVAPGNRTVREIAIRHVAGVLGVSNIDMLWQDVLDEEKRIQAEQDAAAKAKADAAKRAAEQPPPGVAPPGGNMPGNVVLQPPSSNGNGNNPVGQKATTGVNLVGISPTDKRLVSGRAPREGATGPRTRRQ